MQTSTSSDSRSIDLGSKLPFSSVKRRDTDCENARVCNVAKGVVRRAKRLQDDDRGLAGLRAETREEMEGVVRENREAERISRLSRGRTAPFDTIADMMR